MFAKDKFQRFIVMARRSPFLRNNAIFFVGSLSVAVLNYLFYPVLGRMLQPAQFGEVQALLSVYAQGAIFLTVLGLVTIHVTVNNPDPEKRNQILLSLEKIALIIGLAILCVGLLLVNQLKEFLNFFEVWPFVALIITLSLSIPLSFRMAYLRGQKQYARAVFTDGIGSFSKLILSPLLVIGGLGTLGATLGLTLSQIVSLGFAVFWAYKYGFRGFGLNKSSKKVSLAVLAPHFRYALVVFLASSVVTAIFSIDIIAVKHYFSPEIAGQYAGISTIARIIFFLSAPFTGVLLTMVSVNQSAQKNKVQLMGSIGLMAGVGGSALLLMSLFSKQIIKVLVGSKYLQYANLLTMLGLTMLVLSIANAMLMYHVALKKYGVAFLSTLALIFTVSLVYYNHASVNHVVSDLLFGSVVLLILMLGYTVFVYRFSEKP